MPADLLTIQKILNKLKIQIVFITLISSLIGFFYVASKPIIKSYNADILYEVGSLNNSFIDGVNTLNALALAYDFDNISIEKAYNQSHYLIISSFAGNSEEALKNLDAFVNLILKRHNKMIDKRVDEISKIINLLSEQIAIKTDSNLLLKLIEQEELIKSLSKSSILKVYEVEKKIDKPNQILGTSIGLAIGLMISLILVLFQNIFYSDRKI